MLDRSGKKVHKTMTDTPKDAETTFMDPVLGADGQPTSGEPRSSGHRRVSRTAVNFLLDFSLLVAFLGLIWNTAVLRFVFPPATSATGWALWGFNYDDWSGFQFVLVCVLLLGVLLHVMLHWSWICGVIAARVPRPKGQKSPRPDEGAQTLYGVGLIIVIVNAIGLMLAAAALSIRSP